MIKDVLVYSEGITVGVKGDDLKLSEPSGSGDLVITEDGAVKAKFLRGHWSWYRIDKAEGEEE